MRKNSKRGVKRVVKKIKGKKGVSKSKRGKKKRKVSVVIKYHSNPIISPNPENGWEAFQTFNPGAILLDGKVHLVYRAIGKDYVSRFGYANSKDGFHIDEKYDRPVYEHSSKAKSFSIYSYFSGGGFGGAEDPRLVRVDNEDRIYMTYTAFDKGLGVAITSIKVKNFLNKKWKWKKPKLISNPYETHKNWVIFPEKINGKYAILHSISPKIQITYLNSLEFKDSMFIESYYNGKPQGYWKNGWECWIKGVGPTPIKTKEGWLIFYHALDKDFSKYKIGAMLLDLEDPTKILCRSKKPILEPENHYENNGFKPKVVYTTGAVVKDGKLLIYYGASDNYVCVAYAKLKKFLDELMKGIKPALKKGILKEKKNYNAYSKI